MELKNKRILVTGGSSGIGKATARLLVAQGARVIITGRDADKLARVASETGATPFHADMAQPDDLDRLAAFIADSFQGLDGLINNAGIGEFAPLEKVTLDQFQRVFQTNVFGLALLTQKVLPFFIRQQYGNIINVASSAAVRGFANGSVYASSKFALRGMTECWRAELRQHNIRVMLINPSEVLTAFNAADRQERPENPSKLRSLDIAEAIVYSLQLDDRAFIPELSVWATNPQS